MHPVIRFITRAESRNTSKAARNERTSAADDGVSYCMDKVLKASARKLVRVFIKKKEEKWKNSYTDHSQPLIY